jgi:hypothetical protein
MSSPSSYLRSLAEGINANNGTQNCVHCAFRLDEHIAAGMNLSKGAVPKEKAGLYFNPLFKEGKIIRSTSKDERLSNKAAPRAGYLEICDLNDPDHKWLIDTTVSLNNDEIRLLKVTRENLKSILIDLPRRDKDGTAYGLIVLTSKKDVSIGHMLNFYVTEKNEVYFIDSQVHNIKVQIRQDLNLTNFRDEIFYLPSHPPEGLKIKPEHILREIKEEPPHLIEEEFRLAASSEPELPEAELPEAELPEAELPEAELPEAELPEAELPVSELPVSELPVAELPVAELPVAEPVTDHQYRKLLADGQLIDSIELNINNECIIHLKEEHSSIRYLQSIKTMLWGLQRSSADFQENFQFQSRNFDLYLLLKENHRFKTGEEVLNAFIKSTNHPRLPFKKALARGDLIEKVTLDGNKVNLHLKSDYAKKGHYRSINYVFHNFYYSKLRSDLFKEKFEDPGISSTAPTLKLKDNHGFKDADEVHAFLLSCAAPKNRKQPLPLLPSYDLLKSKNKKEKLHSHEEAMPAAMKLR